MSDYERPPLSAAVKSVPPDPSHPGRRERRWVPRGALVFFAITVLLVSVFVIARPDWFGGSDATNAPELTYSKSLADLGHPDGVRLSDDNATFWSTRAALPVDSHLNDVRLELSGRTQAAASSSVFLRVLVDGTSVYVAELESGDHALEADIALPERLIEDGSITVQVRLTGSLEQRLCNLDDDLGALVSLDAEGSRIRGRLDRRLHTVRDVLSALNSQVTVGLAIPGGDKTWYETAARVGVALTQQGRHVAYQNVAVRDERAGSHILLGSADHLTELGWSPADHSEVGGLRVGYIGDSAVLAVVEPSSTSSPLPLDIFLTTDAVTTADAATNEPRIDQAEQLPGDAVSLSALSMDSSVQQITGERSWRTSYSIADLPRGRVPNEVRLDLLVPVVADEDRWFVQVTLNGQLLEIVRLPGDDAVHRFTARIPEGIERLRNDLAVRLLDNRDFGGCNVRPPSYQVQLLPTSNLRLGGSGAGFTAVPSEFAAGFAVYLPTSSTDDSPASLVALVPTLAEFSGWRQQADFVWDGAPGTGPFLLLGEPPAELEVAVHIADGRLVAAGFDLQTFQDGLVIQRAASGSARGLVVTAKGIPPVGMPAYGRENTRLVTGVGDGLVVSDSGRILTAPLVRAGR